MIILSTNEREQMFTLLNPTKTADLSAYVVTSKDCPTCNTNISVEISPEKLFLYNQGGYVQDVLSEFGVEIRERFITGLCSDCWWFDDEEDLVALPDSVPIYVAQLFTLSEQMLHAGVDDWATEVRVIANSLAEGLGLS